MNMLYMHPICVYAITCEICSFRGIHDCLVQQASAVCNKQVLYVLPITSILGKLPVVPVGDTGTIPHSMRGESADFDGASCDSKQGEGDGCRWWYVNSWAMTWSSRM